MSRDEYHPSPDNVSGSSSPEERQPVELPRGDSRSENPGLGNCEMDKSNKLPNLVWAPIHSDPNLLAGWL